MKSLEDSSISAFQNAYFQCRHGLSGACGLFISLAAPFSPQKGEMGETFMFQVATLTVRTRQNLSGNLLGKRFKEVLVDQAGLEPERV
jgi:hypothetical protein